jgi:hypothetical protein
MEIIRLGFDSEILCREDDEEATGTEESANRVISETDMNKIMAAREKKLLGQFEKRVKGMKFATPDDLEKLVTELQPSSGEEGGSAEIQNSIEEVKGDENLPAGVRAELSKLHKQMGKMSEDNKRLQDEAQAKDHRMVAERRKHNTEALLTEAGAVRPNQCYKIISDQIVSDDELGDAVSIKTEHGDDVVSVKEFVDTFKEENPHLFTQPAKSGSGAGGGGSVDSKPRFSVESIRDPKDGGMSWEDYEKNRDKIISDFEQRK